MFFAVGVLNIRPANRIIEHTGSTQTHATIAMTRGCAGQGTLVRMGVGPNLARKPHEEHTNVHSKRVGRGTPRSAKPLYVGSIPTRASILFLQLHESTVLAIVQAFRFRSASMGESRAANCVNAR